LNAGEGTLSPTGGASPVLKGEYTYASITDKIADIVLARRAGRGFWIALCIASAFFVLFIVAITYLFAGGVGIWGINEPVAWAFALTNFVW
jgi:hypothetical protein